MIKDVQTIIMDLYIKNCQAFKLYRPLQHYYLM